MTKISYIITGTAISAVLDGQPFTVGRDNPAYFTIRTAISEGAGAQELAELFETARAATRYTNGAIQVKDGLLFYKGEEIHNVVVDRIFEFMQSNLPYQPLINFMERLLANPSKTSVEELYTFLEHKNMPVTPEGFFLGYKGVRGDYLDVHSGKFSNQVGQRHAMERRNVDDDRRRGCSYGFHVGSLEYATQWGERTMIVEVDPADVVSVPEDCEFQKLRTCKYRVVAEYRGPLGNGIRKSSDPYEEEIGEYIY